MPAPLTPPLVDRTDERSLLVELARRAVSDAAAEISRSGPQFGTESLAWEAAEVVARSKPTAS